MGLYPAITICLGRIKMSSIRACFGKGRILASQSLGNFSAFLLSPVQMLSVT